MREPDLLGSADCGGLMMLQGVTEIDPVRPVQGLFIPSED